VGYVVAGAIGLTVGCFLNNRKGGKYGDY